MDLEVLLRDPHARKRLDLIKKTAIATKDMTNEQLLPKGIQLIIFSKSDLFKIDDS